MTSARVPSARQAPLRDLRLEPLEVLPQVVAFGVFRDLHRRERLGPRTCVRVARRSGPSLPRRESAGCDRTVSRSELEAFRFRPFCRATPGLERAGRPSPPTGRAGQGPSDRPDRRRPGAPVPGVRIRYHPGGQQSQAPSRWIWAAVDVRRPAGARGPAARRRSGWSRSPSLSRADQTGTSCGTALQAGIEPPLGLVVRARSDRQVRSTQPDAIIVGSHPIGLVEIGANLFDRVGLEGKLDVHADLVDGPLRRPFSRFCSSVPTTPRGAAALRRGGRAGCKSARAARACGPRHCGDPRRRR